MVSGPRACAPEELAELVELCDRVFRPQGGGMGPEYPLVFDPDDLECCRVIAEEGRLVSHVGVSIRDASVLGCPLRVASIGAVCTDPAARGKGYASLLMEDARRLAVSRGASLMLISGGRGLYHRLGFVNVGRFRHFRLEVSALSPLPASLRVAVSGESEIPQLGVLYQQRPLRFVRPPEDWHKLLRAGMLMDRKADCLGVWEGERLVAYAGAQRPSTERGGVALPRVQEYAGSETALFAALPAVAAQYGATEVEVTVMPGSQDLPRLLTGAGAAATEHAFPGTLGVIAPERFWTAIGPYLYERLGSLAERIHVATAEEGGLRLFLDGEEYALTTMGQLTAFLFGGDTPEACEVPPAPHALGPTLEQAFPMPLLWYGYNYV